jgi:hypothetical protein
MTQVPVINKSTFIFCNVDDPDQEIKFQKDERDANQLMYWLEKTRIALKLLNIIKPLDMPRLTGLLSIKEDLPTIK